MSRCLVTGHKGYIGSRVYKELLNQGHEVIGIDLQDGHDINTDLDIFYLLINPLKGFFHSFQKGLFIIPIQLFSD